MVKFRLLITALLLAAWGGLFLHQHPKHEHDLHATHAVCQICVTAQRGSNAVALPAPCGLRAPNLLSAAAITPNFIVVVSIHHGSCPSRAPPAA